MEQESKQKSQPGRLRHFLNSHYRKLLHYGCKFPSPCWEWNISWDKHTFVPFHVPGLFESCTGCRQKLDQFPGLDMAIDEDNIDIIKMTVATFGLAVPVQVQLFEQIVPAFLP